MVGADAVLEGCGEAATTGGVDGVIRCAAGVEGVGEVVDGDFVDGCGGGLGIGEFWVGARFRRVDAGSIRR